MLVDQGLVDQNWRARSRCALMGPCVEISVGASKSGSPPTHLSVPIGKSSMGTCMLWVVPRWWRQQGHQPTHTGALIHTHGCAHTNTRVRSYTHACAHTCAHTMVLAWQRQHGQQQINWWMVCLPMTHAS